jgi:hypothetical protein
MSACKIGKIWMRLMGYINISFFLGSEVWTQDSELAKQALYCLSHTSSSFCFGYFGDGVLDIICLECLELWFPLISASQVARIIVVSHRHQALSVSWSWYYTAVRKVVNGGKWVKLCGVFLYCCTCMCIYENLKKALNNLYQNTI